MYFELQNIETGVVCVFEYPKNTKYVRFREQDLFIIDILKYHSHRYDIKCFFYKEQYIYYRERITTIKELFDVIQKLLINHCGGIYQPLFG